MAQHTVRTTHIQRLIANGARLAQLCDGSSGTVAAEDSHQDPGKPGGVPVEHVLQKAAADLRHAAEELEAERLSCLGWPQV